MTHQVEMHATGDLRFSKTDPLKLRLVVVGRLVEAAEAPAGIK
ncbi:hypothetical protein OP10G_2791 [Fimbriimonas ginsengisoli Gsoil 348]|uniref:Uncharacterized protein n=1 Tax=Fimbriimonas ginsengisoli Gsoil 348 TaxID=661478 RepID=A0A068NX22_FIMGI|nr:hypothetical protein OP10G_2791 [Fimbriimonas ginsengisoli Gsoil 348]